MLAPPFDAELRTVTAPGGKAVKLSVAEMVIFKAIVANHPEPVAFDHIPPPRRHVFLHRLRCKLARVGIAVAHRECGYSLHRIRG